MKPPTVTVLTRDEGTSFTIHTWPPAIATGPVVLIEPAMGMPATYYHRFCEALAEAGITAAVADLRGHETDHAHLGGPGGRLPSHRYDFDYADMVADLDAAITSLEKQYAGQAIVLLGHSMGGQVGIAFAATHPGRLAGLMLIGSGTPHWRHFSPAMLAIAPIAVTSSRILGYFPGKQFRFAGREARSLIKDWARMGLTGRIPAVTPEQLAAVALPVLAFAITGDDLASPSSVDGLVTRLPAAQVDVRTLTADGIDHFKWARRPESVLDQIVEWTSALVGPVV